MQVAPSGLIATRPDSHGEIVRRLILMRSQSRQAANAQIQRKRKQTTTDINDGILSTVSRANYDPAIAPGTRAHP